MAHLWSLAFLCWFILGVACQMSFINPPPFGQAKDFSSNPSYTEGSTFNIIWTEGEKGKGTSLVLYQLNKTTGDWFGEMEYLTQGAVGVTRYSWLVGTRKNMTVSNMFYLSLFQEGKTTGDSNSHYFYITAKSNQQQPTSSATPSRSASSSASPNASTTGASAGGQSPNSSPTSDPTNVPNPSNPPPQSSSSFGTGAKVGVGVGVAAALLLGLGAGYLVFRRRKKTEAPSTTAPSYYPHDGPSYQSVAYRNSGYYGSSLNEAPARSPVEMGQPHPFGPSHDQAKPYDTTTYQHDQRGPSELAS